jgi:hypothetical protein
MSDKLFKFRLGEEVLIARKADYRTQDKSFFEKPSVVGTFHSKVYNIESRKLKSGHGNILIPIYRLAGLLGNFYSSELLAAGNFLYD